MAHRAVTRGRACRGRASAQLSAFLRRQIGAGRVPGGSFLPTVRQLSADHRLAPKTVHRALKRLEAEGLILAEPRQGYRVLARANDPDRGAPLAYIHNDLTPQHWGLEHRVLVTELERAAASKSWPLLAVSSQGRPPTAIIEQLLSLRACGIALDSVDPEILGLIHKFGLPAVMVDAWRPDAALDLVMQDNYAGAGLAVEHLVRKGRRRIAWFGNALDNTHSRERFGGTVAALELAGLELPRSLRVKVDPSRLMAQARALLSRPDRPTGIVALWVSLAGALTRAAQELGLVVGRDLDIVGWSPEEIYETSFRPAVGDAPVSAVVWSIATMAASAVARLGERRTNPDMPVVKIRVPLRLVP